MWRLESIRFKNLFAHVDSAYEFHNGACVVIYGDNKTDEGMENNGAGKSTLFEAVHIGITGESLRLIDREIYINYEADSCEINLVMRNDYRDETMAINRTIFRGGKSAKVSVEINGEPHKELTTVNITNKYILETIGITKLDLQRYFIIGQDSRYTFFTAGDVDKKELINRIQSADMIQPVIDELGKRAKTLRVEERQAEDAITLIEGQIELLTDQINELSNRDETEALQPYYEKLARNQVALGMLDRSLKKAREKERKAHKALEAVRARYESSKQRRAELTDMIKNVGNDMDEYKAIVDDIKRALRKKVHCPKCHTDFVDTEDANVDISEAEKLLETTTKMLVDLSEARSNYRDELDALEAITDEINDATIEYQDLRRAANQIEQEQNDRNEDRKRYNEQIQKIKEETRKDNGAAVLEEQKRAKEKELKESEKSLNEIRKNLELATFWQFHMGPSGFKTFLANKAVKIIEGATNSFLKKFGTGMTVTINGMTVNKDGSVRDKIETLVGDGVNSQPFLGKSGGERGRIQLAGILAFQNLINMSAGEGKGLDLLLLDEVFPGIDYYGQSNIIKILETMGITVMMITQNVFTDFNNENSLYVVKEEGVSRYTTLKTNN